MRKSNVFLRPDVEQPGSLCTRHLYLQVIIIYLSHNINTFIRCCIKKHIARGCNLFYTGLEDDGCHLSSLLGKKYVSTVSHPQIEKRKSSCHFFSQQLSEVMHFHFHHWSNFYLFPSPVLNFALSPPHG